MQQLNVEWIPYMKAYRLYNPKSPQDTVAYEDELFDVEQRALENGCDKLVLCDTDTMHVECW